MQLLKARFGLVGIGCMIELYKLIYHEGYALKWDADTKLLFSSANGISENDLETIVSFAIDKGLFHAGKLSFLGVLTSRGIQKRWLRIAKESNRTVKAIDQNVDLLNPIQETELSVPEIMAKNALSVPESTQSKGKERKEYIREETGINSPGNVSEEPSPIEYSRMIFKAWTALGDRAIQPASDIHFATVLWQKVRPCFVGIHSDSVLAAIQNFASIVTAAPGKYYWNRKVTIEKWATEHLTRFLPDNFKESDFLIGASPTQEREGALALRTDAWDENHIAEHRAAIESRGAGDESVDPAEIAGDTPLGRELRRMG